jgi:hypothetical protein
MRIRDLLLLIALASGTVFAVQTTRLSFRGKDGEIVITNLVSLGGYLDPKNEDLIHFQAKAKADKAHLTWADQNLTADFSTVSGTYNQKREMETLVMGGGVVAMVKRPTSAAESKALQTVVLRSQTIDFNGITRRADMPSAVTIDQDDPAAETSMNAKGNSGYVVLSDSDDKNAKGPIEVASLQGNTRVDLTSIRYATDRPKNAPPVRRKVKFNIVLNADRLLFELAKSGDSYGKITVTGNVKVTGNDPLLFTEVEGYRRIVITLDKNKKPSAIDMGDGPGTTTVIQKKGGTSH